jgi:hypothetical protein
VDTETGLIPVAAAGHAARRTAPARQKALRAAVAAFCAAGAFAALVAYRSEARLDEIKELGLETVEPGATSAEKQAARERGLDLVPSARLLNPDSEVDVQRAVYLERDERRRTALLHELTDREPENIYVWFVRLRTEEREGDLDAARRSYERARELDPRLPPAR